MPGQQHNRYVRAELGGDDVAQAKVAALKQVWPRELVKHCDALLAAPMSDTTFEALAGVVEWRNRRDAPGSDPVARNRRRQRIFKRALQRLKDRHSEEFEAYYREEWDKETAAPDRSANR